MSEIREHVQVSIDTYERLANEIKTAREKARKIWNSGLSRDEIKAMRRASESLHAAVK